MIEPHSGKVTLVGAGPGDPGLITVRGWQTLHEADVVVYDNLVPDELIITLPPHIEKIYVGKKAGAHSMPQEQINQLMVDLARQGKKVTRLKGGDPFVFGRGGEEVRFLKENEVECEVVPGVTAGVAGPAYAGIPTTDRTKASSVTFVTGHKASDKDESSVDWKALAALYGGTLVIYMGVGEVENIVKSLIDGGMSPSRPAAAIERGTVPSQRVMSCSLGDLPARTAAEKIKPPALLVIGEVVDLRPLIEWYGGKPLSGLRVMVTRPADQAQWLYRTLRDLGAELLPFPTIATREFLDQPGWETIEEIPVDSLDRWLVFTSENGVRYFVNQLKTRVGDIRWLGQYNIGAIGTGTARALEEFSLKPDFMPTAATVAELARQMASELDLKESSVVRVQGNLSDNTVADILSLAGATVIPLTVYETYTPEWPEGFREKLVLNPPDVIMFSSGSTVDGLCRQLGDRELKLAVERATIVSIGPMTSRVAESKGLKVNLEAETHSVPAMVELLVEHFGKPRAGEGK